MYIAIAGNIGSGKTSLTGILAERTGARAYYEDSDNPYIGANAVMHVGKVYQCGAECLADGLLA